MGQPVLAAWTNRQSGSMRKPRHAKALACDATDAPVRIREIAKRCFRERLQLFGGAKIKLAQTRHPTQFHPCPLAWMISSERAVHANPEPATGPGNAQQPNLAGFVAAIILDENSRVCFPKSMRTAPVGRSNRAWPHAHMPANPRSQAQEQLLRLYLRLNGFFYVGYIAHSPENAKVRTEIDALAVRFPFHSEPERIVGNDPSIQLSDTFLDVVICEVKSLGQPVRFNDKLYECPLAIASTLRRIGLFSEDEVMALVNPVKQALTPSPNPVPIIPTVLLPSIVDARKIRIRGFIFSPERPSPRPNQAWFIGSCAVFPFITSCLRPVNRRHTCAVNYGAGQWGELACIVHYFKQKPATEVGSMDGLYAALGI